MLTVPLVFVCEDWRISDGPRVQCASSQDSRNNGVNVLLLHVFINVFLGLLLPPCTLKLCGSVRLKR